MSTKIFNGYRGKSTSFEAVLRELMALRPQVAEAGRTALGQWAGREAAAFVDGCATLQKRSIFEHILSTLAERRGTMERSLGRDTEIDVGAEVVVIPCAGAPLALVYAEHTSVRKVVAQALEHWPYWDNTDRPEGVTAEAWAERERIWSEALALDPSGRPSDCGVTITYSAPSYMPNNADLVQHQPSLLYRARKIAEKELFERDVRPDADRHVVIELIMSARWRDKVAEHADCVLPRLSPYTLDDLQKCAVENQKSGSCEA